MGDDASMVAEVMRLVDAVRTLATVRSLEEIVEVVSKTARAITGSDGSTLVLREGSFCHYLEEDALAPLWRGKRFRIEDCVSGRAMTEGRSTVVEDVRTDPRTRAVGREGSRRCARRCSWTSTT